MEEPEQRIIQTGEYVFLCSSTVYITTNAWAFSPTLCIAYLAFVVLYAAKMIKLAAPRVGAFGSPLAIINAFAYTSLLLAHLAGATSPATAALAASSPTPTHQEPSVPGDADNGVSRLPTIKDPLAKDAQTICPGYKATDIRTSNTGMTAILQLNGKPCQAYGNDIEALAFSMSYQAQDRLNVKIQPANISAEQEWWYILPEYVTSSPSTESSSGNASLDNDLSFYWSNSPTFNFRVVRDSTEDVLFNTAGSKIIYEDQFIEFVTQMPADYNLYGLGETIHGFRLGNNFTKVATPLVERFHRLIHPDYFRS